MKTHFRHSTLLSLAGLAVLCTLLLLLGIGRLPFLGPDEPRYVEVAKEMVVTGDWITPRLAGIPWFEKPALLYWLAGSGFSLLGISEFSGRLGVALLASAGVFLVFWFVRSSFSISLGFLTAAILASMGFWVAFSRGATFDMPLTVASELALLCFWWWEEREGGPWALLLAGFALGLAVLAKGLVGIVLPVAIAVAYLLLTRRFRRALRKPGWLAVGSLVFVATAAIWYGPMFFRHGWLFIDQFFIAHHFRRYLSDTYRHPQPVYFFFLVALAGSFPWTGYLLGAIARDVRRVRSLLTMREHGLRVFLWLWILIPIVFFSFSGSKLPGYILPIFPAIALLSGLEVSEAPNARWRIASTSLLVLIASITFALFANGQTGIDARSAWAISSMGILFGAGYAFLAIKRSEKWAVASLAFGIAVIVSVTVFVVSPGLARRESVKELALTALEKARPNEKLVFYLDSHQGVNFYATDLPLRDPRSELITLRHGDEVAPLLAREGRQSLLVMCYERWSNGLFINDKFSAERLASQERRIACSPGCDWVLLRVSRKVEVAGR